MYLLINKNEFLDLTNRYVLVLVGPFLQWSL